MSGFTYRVHRLLVAGLVRSGVGGFKREEGQTFVEYAMVLALVVVTMSAALTFLHDQIDSFYSQISNDFNAALS